MAKLSLPPEQRALLEQTMKELEEQDAQIEALDSVGLLHPGIKEAREANKRAIRVLLEKL